MTEKTIYLIGAGRMGEAHSQAVVELGYSIGGVCDSRAEARNALGDKFNVPAERRYSDSGEMLSSLECPDLVIVATTADTHHDLTCLAADHSVKAILCEKPMAVSVEQCDQMLEKCNAMGVRLAINHQMRFMPQYTLIKSILDEGKLGRLGVMNVVAGCFGLAMNGSHYIEAFHYLTGSWPSKVSAYFTGKPFQNPRGPHYFDQAGEFHFVSDSGQRLNLSIGSDQGHGMTVTYAGEFGHIFIDELEGEAILTSRLAEHRDAPMTRYGMPWLRETITFPQADNVQPSKDVISALLTGENYPSGTNARNIIAALAASYESAENEGQFVNINSNERLCKRTFPWA